jgi:hypothetical protein
MMRDSPLIGFKPPSWGWWNERQNEAVLHTHLLVETDMTLHSTLVSSIPAFVRLQDHLLRCLVTWPFGSRQEHQHQLLMSIAVPRFRFHYRFQPRQLCPKTSHGKPPPPPPLSPNQVEAALRWTYAYRSHHCTCWWPQTVEAPPPQLWLDQHAFRGG